MRKNREMKQWTFRASPEVLEALRKRAEDEGRSMNAQAEQILREALGLRVRKETAGER